MCSTTKLKSLGDDCWDRICPGFNKDQKLACLNEHREDICKCCSNSASGDCNILIPGYGMVDACAPAATPGEDSAQEMLRGSSSEPHYIESNPWWLSPAMIFVYIIVTAFILVILYLLATALVHFFESVRKGAAKTFGDLESDLLPALSVHDD